MPFVTSVRQYERISAFHVVKMFFVLNGPCFSREIIILSYSLCFNFDCILLMVQREIKVTMLTNIQFKLNVYVGDFLRNYSGVTARIFQAEVLR